MSNTRRPREFQKGSGQLTRPRESWKGRKKRGHPMSPLAADMSRQTANLFKSMMSGSFVPKIRLPAKKGRND